LPLLPLLMLLPHLNEWVVFRIERRAKGRAGEIVETQRVLLRQEGLEGLGQGVLLMTQQSGDKRKHAAR